MCGVANRLDALTLTLLAQKDLAGWPDSAEVIVPAHTFVATAQAVVRAGLQPVLVDVLEDGLIAPKAVEGGDQSSYSCCDTGAFYTVNLLRWRK